MLPGARADSIDEVEFILNWLRRQMDDFFPTLDFGIRSIVDLTALRVQANNKSKYAQGLYPHLGLNAVPESVTDPMVTNWAESNVSLITKINSDQKENLTNFFRANAYTGRRAKSLEKELRNIFGGADRRYALIARDQTYKLGGQLDMLKQTSVGIEGYYWRSSEDERVRAEHADREGKYFRWDSPPEDGHPGQPIQCRCDAEPAIDRILGDTEETRRLEISNLEDRKRAIMRSRDYQTQLRRKLKKAA